VHDRNFIGPERWGQPAWRDIGHADAVQHNISRHSGMDQTRNDGIPGSMLRVAPE
jgi:hypothetical protein